jgi:hypothetical protein
MSTHVRNFRCDDELWAAAKATAGAEGRTVTDVIVAALRRLVAPQFGAGTAKTVLQIATPSTQEPVVTEWVSTNGRTIYSTSG